MSYNLPQFRSLVERVLNELDPSLNSPVAIKLLLGTAAQESRFGMYLRQMGGGPAVGAFQMEPATFEWLREKYMGRYSLITMRKCEEMEWDLRLSIVMARLRYRAIVLPLPIDDVTEIARYWKQWYNTSRGDGTVLQFVNHYKTYVEGV